MYDNRTKQIQQNYREIGSKLPSGSRSSTERRRDERYYCPRRKRGDEAEKGADDHPDPVLRDGFQRRACLQGVGHALHVLRDLQVEEYLGDYKGDNRDNQKAVAPAHVFRDNLYSAMPPYVSWHFRLLISLIQ